MAYNYDLNEINKFLSINQMVESDAYQRSILISGLTREVNLETVLNAFSDYNVTGGGVIQSYELYTPNKMRITYFYFKDAERVLSRGSTYKIGKIYLHVSRFAYEFDSSDSSNSSLVTAIVNSSRANTPLEIIKPIDQKRILLTNVPSSIDKDYLDLYLEYLSDEVEIERIDVGEEISNSIVVTYSKFIDFENLKKKHKQRPKILKNTTVVLPVYLPNTVVLEVEKSKKSIEKHLNSEILELYFNNKKRSGGQNVKSVKFDTKKNTAYVSFENFETAKQVCNRIHSINNIEIRAKLYYENIGPDPFLVESKIFLSKKNKQIEKTIKNEIENLSENQQQQSNKSPFENFQINSIPVQKPELAKLVNLLQPNIEFSDKTLIDSSDSQLTSYTIESTLNLNDMPKNPLDKPKVNLPSLDDPILSFEEYAILNNISLGPNMGYNGQKNTRPVSVDASNVRKNSEREEGPTIGGAQGPQPTNNFPSVPDIRANDAKRIELEQTLNKRNFDVEKPKLIIRNQDEMKEIIIGGSNSTKPVSPKKDIIVPESKRFEIENLLNAEVDKAKEKEYEQAGDVGGKQGPQIKSKLSSVSKQVENTRPDEIIIGGSHGKKRESPLKKETVVSETKRIELEKLIIDETYKLKNRPKEYEKESGPIKLRINLPPAPKIADNPAKSIYRKRDGSENQALLIGNSYNKASPTTRSLSPRKRQEDLDKRRVDLENQIDEKAKNMNFKLKSDAPIMSGSYGPNQFSQKKTINIDQKKIENLKTSDFDKNKDKDKLREEAQILSGSNGLKIKIELPSVPPLPKQLNNMNSKTKNDDEKKDLVIGGSRTVRPPSPQKNTDARRAELNNLVSNETEINAMKQIDDLKGFVIGGSHSVKPPSPPRNTDTRRAELDNLFSNETEKNNLKIINDFKSFVTGGLHSVRPPSPPKNSDTRGAELDNLVSNETEINAIRRIDDLKGFVIGGSQTKRPITPIDSKPLPQKKPIPDSNSKLDEKIDAIKKLLDDPKLLNRIELENLLYGISTTIPKKNGINSSEKKIENEKRQTKTTVEHAKSQLRHSAIPENLDADYTPRIRTIGIPPMPKVTNKVTLNTSLGPNQTSQKSDIQPKVILKQRPFSTIEPSFFKRDSSEPQESLNKNHIISQYGNHTTADSINRLNPKFIEFLKTNSYLDGIRRLYPKINISLNETQKRLYFFGAKRQVTEAKGLILKDLESIKTIVIKLNRKELAFFLNKSEVRKQLTDFFKSILNEKLKNSSDADNMYFTYDIITKLNPKDSQSEDYSLNINTNYEQFLPIFHEFVNKNVMVDIKIEINSSHLIESIKNEDLKWEEFYVTKYEPYIDYKLEFHKIRNKITEKIDQKCYLKLTGFKDKINEFQNDLALVYKLKKVL